jgi:hypothetical protein
MMQQQWLPQQQQQQQQGQVRTVRSGSGLGAVNDGQGPRYNYRRVSSAGPHYQQQRQRLGPGAACRRWR